jgi:hypothetical protein
MVQRQAGVAPFLGNCLILIVSLSTPSAKVAFGRSIAPRSAPSLSTSGTKASAQSANATTGRSGSCRPKLSATPCASARECGAPTAVTKYFATTGRKPVRPHETLGSRSRLPSCGSSPRRAMRATVHSLSRTFAPRRRRCFATATLINDYSENRTAKYRDGASST